MFAKTIGPNLNLSAVTTGSGAPVACVGNLTELTVYVLGINTISAGTLIVEECYADPASSFGGTWSQIASVDLTSLSGGGAAGKQVAVHAVGCYWNVRTRVSVDVTGSGGAVSTWVLGAAA